MEILFTKSNSILSRIIRTVTGEQVSHCAIRDGNWVVHSNLLGVQVTSYRTFSTASTIVWSVLVTISEPQLLQDLATYEHSSYDFGALLYLGLSYLLPFLPKANLWQTTGMFLCTEWVTSVLYGTELSDLTPEQLYNRLKREQV